MMNAPVQSEPTAAEAAADSAGTKSKKLKGGRQKAQMNTSSTGPLRDPEQKTDQLDETAERQGIDAAASVTAQKRSTGPGGRGCQKAEGQ